MEQQSVGPRLIEPAELRARPGRPVGRVIVDPAADPSRPAFFEWRLDAQEWSDEHPFDEYVYVLDGELHVTVDGITVVTGPGGLVHVPAGHRGAYAAPVHARILSIYGPRPAEVGDPHGILRALGGPGGAGS